jgi:hypothetical protein
MKAEEYKNLIKHFEIAYLFSISKKDNLPKKKVINKIIEQFLKHAENIEKDCFCNYEESKLSLNKIKVFECKKCKKEK